MTAARYQFSTGNHLELLESGTEYFPALCSALDAACREIHLQTYIFEDDATGRRVAAALAQAARRGVAVHLVVDGFGARNFPETLQPELEASGVKVRVFRPELARFSFRRHRLRRLHRKVAIIDGRLAFVGGINIIDDMHTPGQIPPRYDYAVAVTGPVLDDILHTCRNLWEMLDWAYLRQHLRRPRPTPLEAVPLAGGMEARFVVRDNLRHRRDIEDAYLQAIEGAREEIVLANAYFLPGRRIRHALLAAAQRRVRVILLLQGKVEYLLLHFATRALYGRLLDGGIRIFEYRHSFLHAKVAVVDGRWATVGSSNIDPFSLLLAREANLEVRDTGFALGLRKSLQTAMNLGAVELKPMDWKRQPRLKRFASWSAFGLVRLLIGLAGYGAKH